MSQFTRWRPPTVRQTLLGVASFHRACLLAQDFTHEPACQTGERAPQGRFRHQPEQMVHPSFWQLASFPSLPVCGEEAPFCPLRNFVTLRTYSLEIKVQQALSVFLSVYPELVGVVGGNVPNYQGVFLRGHGSQTSTHYGTVTHASADLGELQGDSIREIWGVNEWAMSSWSHFPATTQNGAYYFVRRNRLNTEIRDGGGHDFDFSAYFNASRVTPTSSEIRPINKAVIFLIRAK